jgi:signal peptidase I
VTGRPSLSTVFTIAFVVLAVGVSLTPYTLTYVTSDSMAPALTPGDVYVVGPADDVGAGDVVVFYSTDRGEYVTHRVVEVRDGGYETSGDANDVTWKPPSAYAKDPGTYAAQIRAMASTGAHVASPCVDGMRGLGAPMPKRRIAKA